jgi:hypothetical protein
MRIKTIVCLTIILTAGLLAQTGIRPQDESFDPGVLKEPPLPLLDNTLIYEIVTDPKAPAARSETPDDSVRYIEKMGWKVQVFSSSDFFLADSIYRQVQQKFQNVEVEKVFNLPYYKIRIGNCATREEAERLLARAQEMHYSDAWIIRTQIRIITREDIF